MSPENDNFHAAYLRAYKLARERYPSPIGMAVAIVTNADGSYELYCRKGGYLDARAGQLGEHLEHLQP